MHISWLLWKVGFVILIISLVLYHLQEGWHQLSCWKSQSTSNCNTNHDSQILWAWDLRVVPFISLVHWAQFFDILPMNWCRKKIGSVKKPSTHFHYEVVIEWAMDLCLSHIFDGHQIGFISPLRSSHMSNGGPLNGSIDYLWSCCIRNKNMCLFVLVYWQKNPKYSS